MRVAVEPGAKPELLVLQDSDFASCPFTSRSTSGIIYVIRTGQSCCPILWSSKKQGSTARSTTEAVLFAFAGALFGEALNLHTMAEHVTEQAIPIKFEQDNQAAIAVLQSGYSAKLRHVGRVHRVNIASIHEQLEDNTFLLEYCDTKLQLANGLTKIINGVEWQTTLQQFCVVPF